MDTKARILAVDDDRININIIKEILSDTYDVTCAFSGKQALELIGQHVYDLILLDIMLPDIDGYELCTLIKKEERLKNTRVFLVSSKAMTEERLKGYDVGADNYITKPFNDEELLAKIKVFLR